MVQDAAAQRRGYKVVLHPSGIEFEAMGDVSLLMSALQAGVRLPSSCRNGTCRTCLCILKQGQIRYQIDWPGLTSEEKLAGNLLPCVAVPTSDVVIEAVDAVFTCPTAQKKNGSGF